MLLPATFRALLTSIVPLATTIALSTAPATAAPTPVRILSVSAENVKPGETVRVKFRVTNTGKATETAIVVVGGGLECQAGCRAEPSLGAGRSRNFEAKLVAPSAGPGTTGLNISAAVRLGGQNYFDHKTVYVSNSAPSPSKPDKTLVSRVSGRVRDADGKAISGAALTVRDSAGHKYRATSDRSGRFSVTSKADQPIAAGPITVVAAMDGYRTARKSLTGTAGGTASTLLTLTAVAKVRPSPVATVSPLAAAAEPETIAPTTTAPPDLQAVSDEGSGSMPFMALGGLLIAVGLGAIALVAIRRRHARS
ncbi:carboxypeptidase-like regulatory domain-containing protein [Actinoplanes sp. TRM 88003]|uniref:Carboxypeptidase-like regulatory domain-containing protein n=1 Tax=Paractinoplanes aksuensis TaxID=2939490 RepID=A0ABT1E353_9ACTN|nr:carboxypeptidase-like regulatory domain-containing protein [Actinoplanes aksuensis]MCO8277565.1 carboxypeptidase-like regulatory domain-containing protein [Actinoplanes aksuensis]